MAAVAEQFCARLAGDVLHHDEVLVVSRIEAEVEHLDDVRMHEARCRQRLAAEPRHERWVIGEVLGQQLDRHVTLEPAVEREVDGRHSANPEPALNPVPACDRCRASHCPLPLPAPPAAPPPAPAAPLLDVSPAPPLEVVPVPVGFVPVPDGLVVVLVVVGVVVVDVVVGVVVDVVVDDELLEEELLDELLEQSRAASALIVAAP